MIELGLICDVPLLLFAQPYNPLQSEHESPLTIDKKTTDNSKKGLTVKYSLRRYVMSSQCSAASTVQQVVQPELLPHVLLLLFAQPYVPL